MPATDRDTPSRTPPPKPKLDLRLLFLVTVLVHLASPQVNVVPVVTTLFTKSFNVWKPISKNVGNVFANRYYINNKPIKPKSGSKEGEYFVAPPPEVEDQDDLRRPPTVQVHGEAEGQKGCSTLCKLLSGKRFSLRI